MTKIKIITLIITSLLITQVYALKADISIANISLQSQEGYYDLKITDARNLGDKIIAVGVAQKSKDWNSRVGVIFCLNNEGVMLWNKELDQKSIEGLNCLKDGTFWITSNLKDDETGRSSILLQKFNKNGEKLSSKIISDNELSFLSNGLTNSKDGEFLIGGTTKNESEDIYVRKDKSLVIKVSDKGDLIWKRTYENFRYNLENATDIKMFNDGSFAFTGYSRNFKTDKYSTFTVKAFEDGEVEWVQTYAGDESVRLSSARPRSLLITNNEEVIVVGINNAMGFVFFKGQSGFYWDICVLKYNSYGEFEWEFTEGDPDENRRDKGYDAIQNANGNILVLGDIATEDAFKDHDTYVFTLNSNGQKIASKKIGDGNYNPSNFIQFKSTGEIYVIGSYEESEGNYTIMLKEIE